MSQILVIDDEENVRHVLKAWMTHAGHQCLEAEDAEAALAVMAQTPADVAFCDIQMPGRDGIWLTGELRRRYPMMPVVLATGVSTVPATVSMQAGVLAYLVKPFNRNAVTHAIDLSVKWRDETARAGPRAEDVGDRLTDWLDSLQELCNESPSS